MCRCTKKCKADFSHIFLIIVLKKTVISLHFPSNISSYYFCCFQDYPGVEGPEYFILELQLDEPLLAFEGLSQDHIALFHYMLKCHHVSGHSILLIWTWKYTSSIIILNWFLISWEGIDNRVKSIVSLSDPK